MKLHRTKWPRTLSISTNVLNNIQVTIVYNRMWFHGRYIPHMAFKIEEEIIIW